MVWVKAFNEAAFNEAASNEGRPVGSAVESDVGQTVMQKDVACKVKVVCVAVEIVVD